MAREHRTAWELELHAQLTAEAAAKAMRAGNLTQASKLTRLAVLLTDMAYLKRQLERRES